jgi:hypothetical protein
MTGIEWRPAVPGPLMFGLSVVSLVILLIVVLVYLL